MELALQGVVNKSRFFLLLAASKSMRFETNIKREFKEDNTFWRLQH
jgi:hypothetical protein